MWSRLLLVLALAVGAGAAPTAHATTGPTTSSAAARTELLVEASGNQRTVRHRPRHVTLQHYTLRRARWSAWTNRRATGVARVTAVFPGAEPRTSVSSVSLSRPRTVCGVRSYTVLRVDGRKVARLVPSSGFCGWVIQ